MQYQRLGDRYQVRIESGEQLLETILPWLRAEGIGYAAISGLGALREVTLSYWNADTQYYETQQFAEQMEVVSMIGNVTLREDAPFLHLHVALGRRDLSVIGGHFNDAVIHPTLELWLRPEKEAVQRMLDESCGLFVMQLPKRP